MKSEGNRPISLEDLLRLKRAEQPPTEFWAQFDRQLRAKQLAAIVGKRPWWQRLPSLLPRLSRYRIPLGASAAIALTFVSYREYHTNGQDMTSHVSIQSRAINVASAPAAVVSNENIAHEILPPQSSLLASPKAVEVISRAEKKQIVDAAASSEVSRVIPLLGTASSETKGEQSLSSARLIAANLAISRTDSGISSTLLHNSSAFERPASRPAVEPLQQMTPPGETRRGRFLAAMVTLNSADAPSRSSERVANRLSEEQLYDQIHRFGARGAGVSYKF